MNADATLATTLCLGKAIKIPSLFLFNIGIVTRIVDDNRLGTLRLLLGTAVLWLGDIQQST